MRLRSALLVTCLAGAASAVAAATAIRDLSSQPPPNRTFAPPPGPPPAPPRAPLPPPRPMAPEVRATLAEARETERLINNEQYDGAIANYRASIVRPPVGDIAGVAYMRSVHLWVLATALIRAGRSGDADELLAAFVAAASPVPRRGDAGHRELVRFVELRIYIASGRGDAPGLIALLDQRDAIMDYDGPHSCIASPLMPDSLAPMHRNPAVRAHLRRLGCSDEIIDQIDRLADEPIGPPFFLPAPGRRRVEGLSGPG